MLDTENIVCEIMTSANIWTFPFNPIFMITCLLIFFSISPDKFGDYPIWLTLYIAQVILPMVALAAVAIKILVKSGKDMRREMWGVSVQQITNKPQKKPENLVEKLENVSTGSGEDSEFSWGGFFKGQDVSN